MLEVVAQGTNLALYANNQKLASVNDATFKEGVAGPVALEEGHVIASTFKVWELP